VRRPLAWLLGAFALFGFLRRRQQPVRAQDEVAETDPRAEELRRKLAESRAMLEEREQFEAAETPVDQAEPLEDPEARRRAVHESARASAERMRERG
jgi:hypothetical protein